MIFEYCVKCGKKLDKKEIGDEGLVPFCLQCNEVFFSFSYPCVLCLVINEDGDVILVKNARTGKFGGIAGYIKEGETAESAAVREVNEEISGIVIELKYFKSYYYEKNDRLMLGFICKVKNTEFSVSKELNSVERFSFEDAKSQLRDGSIIHTLLTEYYKALTK
jgi:NAD+ diphosphatase